MILFQSQALTKVRQRNIASSAFQWAYAWHIWLCCCHFVVSELFIFTLLLSVSTSCRFRILELCDVLMPDTCAWCLLITSFISTFYDSKVSLKALKIFNFRFLHRVNFQILGHFSLSLRLWAEYQVITWSTTMKYQMCIPTLRYDLCINGLQLIPKHTYTQ